MMRLATVAAGAVLVALVAAPGAAAQRPELDFVSPDEIALKATDGESGKKSVWLRNASDKDVLPRFRTSLEDADGNAIAPDRIEVIVVDDKGKQVAPAAVTSLGPNSVDRYRFFLKGSELDEDVSGQLVATGTGVAPASASLSVGPKAEEDVGADDVLMISLGAAVALILVAWLVAGRVSLKSPLGALDLDFSASFASTLTAVGALLGTVISAGVLPDDTVNLSKEAFTALNLLFGVVIVMAGLAYSALQTAVWVDKEGDANKQVRKLQGYAGSFLLACIFTVWAVFGELWTLGLLVDELGQDGGFTGLALSVFRLLLVASALAMIFYTVWRVQSMLKSERPKPGTAAAAAAIPMPAHPPEPVQRISLL